MKKTPITFLKTLLKHEPKVRYWVLWLIGLHLCSVFFLEMIQARLILINIILASLGMYWLYTITGYNRLMGAVHLVLYPIPLLYSFLTIHQMSPVRPYSFWITLYMISISVSLMLDLYDVIRYYLGKKGELV